MFQTIYTFRILSFQNSARRAVPQILFITHSAKIISVHTAPPMAQMLRNLQQCFDPDIRVEAICVRRKWNTKPRDSGGGDFYKYEPNLCSGHWGSSFIYVCFCLLGPRGGLFSQAPTATAACARSKSQNGAKFHSWGLSLSLSLSLSWEAALEQGSDGGLWSLPLVFGTSSPKTWALPASSVKWG